jgi:replicative DNA helicase Mcm
MDAQEQIEIFREFFESTYQKSILENASSGKNVLVVDFAELSKFNLELSEALLEEPEEVIKAAEIGLDQLDKPNADEKWRVRFSNLPESQKVRIRDIRSSHIGRFLRIEGTVRQKTDVRPQVTAAKFECPSCGAIIPILQADSKFREPSVCSCGRKGKFRLLSKELVDAQSLTLEESADDLDGGEQPKRMKVFLRDDLVSPLSEKKTNPGTRIVINGLVKEVPIQLRTGGQSTRYDLIIEANNIEAVVEEFSDIDITPEEEEEIKNLSKDPKLIETLVKSLAPSIYGHEMIKEALLLLLVGGVTKKRKDGVRTRGDIHVLLVGDPGAGKSQMLKRVDEIAPKSRFVSGKGASGAGLTATVVKDEFLGGWALEAGALVLAHKGMICIDELDKMSKEDTSAMHEALEGQTVTISKANIQATLRSETTVLAAANPKFGRFDPYAKTLAEQIDLPPTLINRFDLIFPVKDLPDPEKDKRLAKFILTMHKDSSKMDADIETEMLRKYIAYSKKLRPKLTDDAIKVIMEYYLKMRGSGSTNEGIKTIPISARQLEGLVRMSEAFAKLRLSEKVAKKDAKRAVELLHYCMKEIAYDEETGTFDMDKIATGIPTSTRNKLLLVKNIIKELDERFGKEIPIEEVLELASQKGIDEEETESILEKLSRSGDIYSPKRKYIAKMN